MDPHISFVAGNGLTIDLASRHQFWHPSEPLVFPFTMPGGLNWKEALPVLAASLPQNIDNAFDVFKALGDRRDTSLESEIRHFLTIAYSNFDIGISEQMLLHWPWRKWIRRHYRRIGTVISFNYETVLERSFELSSGRKLYNACAQNRIDGIGPQLFKPHGSIDLVSTPGSINIGEPCYPIRVHLTRNNTPVLQCDRENYLKARTESFAVLPAETSPYTDFQLASPLYKNWPIIAARVTHFVIAGISYWECDRDEIDFLIEGLPRSAEIIVANPRPPAALISRLENAGRNVRLWTSGPEPVWT